MKRKESKCCALSLLIGALLGLICGSAQGAWEESWVDFAPVVSADQESESYTTVNFGGHQWLVVGTPSSTGEKGVYDSNNGEYTGGSGIASPKEKTLTLLLKDGDSGFADTHFRTDNGEAKEGFTYYDYMNWGYYTGWYADNEEGEPWVNPNEYRGSTLQQAMKNAADTIFTPSSKEGGVIVERDLKASDDDENGYPMKGGPVDDQKFWALSYDEWYQLTSKDARAYLKDGETDEGWSSAWWLRSPDSDSNAILGLPGGAD